MMFKVRLYVMFALGIISSIIVLFAVVLFSPTQEYEPTQSLRDNRYTEELPFQSVEQSTFFKTLLLTLDKTHRFVVDVNADKQVNCIDYTITFKQLWDMNNPAFNCEIVRNLNGDFHHLFIRVREYSKSPWHYIEPQAAIQNIYCFYMEDYWGSTYNPMFNITGETDYWLQQKRIF